MKKVLKILPYLLVGTLVIIQFFQIDKTHPPIDPSKDFVALENPPEAIAKIMKTACYDCHSYNSRYPWYANIAPVSWWLGEHIEDAREEVNFSLWADYSADDKAEHFEDMEDEIEEGGMPLKQYTWMHSAARLSKEQRADMVDWLEKKM